MLSYNPDTTFVLLTYPNMGLTRLGRTFSFSHSGSLVNLSLFSLWLECDLDFSLMSHVNVVFTLARDYSSSAREKGLMLNPIFK